MENKVIIMYFVGVFCLIDSFVWEWIMPINKICGQVLMLCTQQDKFLMLASSILL